MPEEFDSPPGGQAEAAPSGPLATVFLQSLFSDMQAARAYIAQTFQPALKRYLRESHQQDPASPSAAARAQGSYQAGFAQGTQDGVRIQLAKLKEQLAGFGLTLVSPEGDPPSAADVTAGRISIRPLGQDDPAPPQGRNSSDSKGQPPA